MRPSFHLDILDSRRKLSGSVLKEVHLRAIVIDDSSAMRSWLHLVLERRGFQVAEAENGVLGLRVLQKSGPVDVAIIDWNMPEMSGLTLVQAIRNDRHFDEMRLIMATTETDLSRVVKALRCGADEYVMKPFDEEILAEKLKLVGF